VGNTLSDPARQRRRYDSPLRRQRAAETKERIVLAGAELLHGFPIWNWHALTVRAVAERAGVNERTVYRHFPNERALRDAVLVRLEHEAGVDLEGLTLEGVREITARILSYASAFPLQPRTPRDDTVVAANARQRGALLDAVTAPTAGWSRADRSIAAAMFDVLWSVVSYERLVTDWEFDPGQAIRAITWVMGLLEEAIAGARERRPEDPSRDRDVARHPAGTPPGGRPRARPPSPPGIGALRAPGHAGRLRNAGLRRRP
jgi:AcrR family transcriptional regulator